MSSNPYHNIPVITRSNYEEYLLLYVDDELTAEEKVTVEQFLVLNPDLQQELDILMQTKLSPDWLLMEEKDALLSGSMQAMASEESLLLYIDNELNEKEKKEVEETLQKDDAYRLQFELLLKTKSDPGEKLVYPFKEELYRREERRIPVLWWRVAAVILLVAGIGTFIMTYQKPQPEDVATLPPGQQAKPSVKDPQTNPQQPVQQVDVIAMQNSDTPGAPAQTINTPDKTVQGQVPVIAKTTVTEKETETRTINTRVQSTPAEEDLAVSNMRRQSNDLPVLMPEKVEEPVSKPLTNDPVTSKPLYTYNKSDAPVNAVPAVAYEETEKSKSSLKGLLRKATRYVERRANINVTNENEEFVIGTVAISLK